MNQETKPNKLDKVKGDEPGEFSSSIGTEGDEVDETESPQSTNGKMSQEDFDGLSRNRTDELAKIRHNWRKWLLHLSHGIGACIVTAALILALIIVAVIISNIGYYFETLDFNSLRLLKFFKETFGEFSKKIDSIVIAVSVAVAGAASIAKYFRK